MTDLASLRGKRIAITGASGDIGRALIRLFLESGARVAAIDRELSALEDLLQVRENAGRLSAFAADVTDECRLAKCFGEIADHLGGLDGLVNAAGIEGTRAPIDAYPLNVFQNVIEVNVTGVFLGMKCAIPLLRASGGGSIVNLASTAGLKGAEGMSAYVASKHAVIGLTRTAGLEWMRHGIRVNCVCPGPIAGRMIDSIFSSKPGQPSDAATARMSAIPSQRFGTPDEVAQVVQFLLTDAASLVNGACYAIDGGISAS